jgi:ATP-dependent helicase/nuclease subunit B
MFDPEKAVNLFGVPNGVDFPKSLVDGLIHRMNGRPPHDMASVEIIVNTRRMARRMRELFDAGPALLLPRIRLLSEVEELLPDLDIPRSNTALKRRLELVQLVTNLLEKEKSFAARASAFDLADSLAALMDEMQGEGVSAEVIASGRKPLSISRNLTLMDHKTPPIPRRASVLSSRNWLSSGRITRHNTQLSLPVPRDREGRP